MLILLEAMLFLLAVTFVATQLVWPIMMDRPVLPILKYRRHKQRLHNVQEDIERVNDSYDLTRDEREVLVSAGLHQLGYQVEFKGKYPKALDAHA